MGKCKLFCFWFKTVAVDNPIVNYSASLTEQYNTIQYNNNICRALFTKRPGVLMETSDDMLCKIVQSLNGA